MTEEDLAKFEAQHGDCEPEIAKYIWIAVGIFMVLGVLIGIYFVLVPYTYWQEAVENEEKGNSGDEREDETALLNDN